mmetsp:Transcript_8001/g.16612  ORF Transcript_8001/g.16612 Transcript_8001/m.16612 type:complete len:103 (+) Transcript_8001:335-643(+)
MWQISKKHANAANLGSNDAHGQGRHKRSPNAISRTRVRSDFHGMVCSQARNFPLKHFLRRLEPSCSNTSLLKDRIDSGDPVKSSASVMGMQAAEIQLAAWWR